MFTPDVDPEVLRKHLPIMSIDEMEDLLKEVNERLRFETDGRKIMKLMDNQAILENAIDNYYL